MTSAALRQGATGAGWNTARSATPTATRRPPNKTCRVVQRRVVELREQARAHRQHEQRHQAKRLYDAVRLN